MNIALMSYRCMGGRPSAPTVTYTVVLFAFLLSFFTLHATPAIAIVNCGATVYSNTSANGTYQSGIGHNHRYQGARFTPTTTVKACTIYVVMTKIEGDISAKKFVLRVWDFNGTGLGNQLAYSSVVGGNNTWSQTEVAFQLPSTGFRFVAGTAYAVTLDMGENDASNYAGWNLGYALPEQTVCAYDAITRAQYACNASYSVLMRIVGNESASASCSDRLVNTVYQDYSAPIHTTTGNYYRGGIYTLAEPIGICTVTAYLALQAGASSPNFYTLKLWSLGEDDNLTTLLATSQDIYQGGNWTLKGDDNWTLCRKTFHFYEPVRVPAGRLAITLSDNNGTAHPTNYHAWVRGPAQSGVESCAWSVNGYGVDPVAEGELQFGDYNVATDTDNTTLVWTSSGGAVWTKQISGSHDGVDVARSGAIENSQSSSISTTVIGPGTLTFWWNVSSELNYDYLSFYVDSVLQTGRISGPSHAWEQQTHSIASGEHTLTWTYAKDGSAIGGTDQAWLDQVAYSNIPPPQPYIPGTDNCTSEAAPMIELSYVETPFLTSKPRCRRVPVGAPPHTWICPDYPYMGWLQIPEWSAYGLDWCQLNDNATVGCELPDAIKALPGNYALRGRFVPPDGNTTNASAWAHFRHKITDQGGGQVGITNHSHGDYSATITGEAR